MEPPRPGRDFYLDGEPHVDPTRIVAHYCAQRGVEPSALGIRPVVLGTFSPRRTRELAELAGATRADGWADWHGTEAYIAGDALTIAQFGIGAPMAVAEMEEMIACGMRTLITMGSAGSLQPSAPIATIVVPSSAIREEGTSHHYAPHDTPAVPDEALALELAHEAETQRVACQRGVNWTTDAVYREHRAKIARYRDEGVVTVDMELSALFTVAALRGVRCAAIVAVSDELHGSEWELGFGGEPLTRAMACAGRVALAVAQRCAGISAETPG